MTAAAAQASRAAGLHGLAAKTIAGRRSPRRAMVPASGVVPTYCRVSAKIEPSLNFQLRIPAAWNGKLHYGGGGGFDGLVRRGIYRRAATDNDNHGLNLAALNKVTSTSSRCRTPGKVPGLEAVTRHGCPATGGRTAVRGPVGPT